MSNLKDQVKNWLERIPRARSKPIDPDEELLDWDSDDISHPDCKESGTIKVKLIYKGRRKPLPIEDID